MCNNIHKKGCRGWQRLYTFLGVCVAQTKSLQSLGVSIKELAKKIASGIGDLKRVRDYVPNTALQSIFNSQV